MIIIYGSGNLEFFLEAKCGHYVLQLLAEFIHVDPVQVRPIDFCQDNFRTLHAMDMG